MTRHALLVSDVYFPRVNGVSTSLHTFCTDLGEAGVQTTLVAPDYGRPIDAALNGAPGVQSPWPRVLRVPSRPVPRDPEDRLMSWRALNAQLALVPERPYDLVHIHTPFLAHYAGVRAARRLGVPVLATCHTYFEDYLHHYLPLLPHALGRALARRLTVAQFSGLDAVIAPTAPLLERLRDYGVRTPIHVIPTGLPPLAFQAGDGLAFRHAHGIDPTRPVALILGRVAYEKNLSFLLRMFTRLAVLLPGTLLLVAGEGPARESLQREAASLGIAGSTCFIGNLERGQALADCYAAADVFVFASRTETQGLTLLEAMAQGRPVVSTACLGTRSVLAEGCGAEVVPEDEQVFAAACVRVLTDPGLAGRLSGLGVAWARRWSSRGMAWRLAELYAELAGETRRADGAAPATA
jgi:1,2-diacylglycerol 3-alpha-glucosyltransferase